MIRYMKPQIINLVLCKQLIRSYLLVVASITNCAVYAVDYVYPNAQSGYTLWTLNSTLTARTDTLSFNGDATVVNSDPIFNTTGTGDIAIVALTPSVITMQKTDTNNAQIANINNIGNFTMPSNLQFVYETTQSLGAINMLLIDNDNKTGAINY